MEALKKKKKASEGKIVPNAFGDTPKPIIMEIFSYLNYKQLIMIRRVCKNWKDMIDGSESLFERLFNLNYPQYFYDKPEELGWQQYYIQTIHHLLSDTFNSVENNPEFFVELDGPMQKGIRRILRRAGALFIDNDVYDYLEKELENYLRDVIRRCADLSMHYRCHPYIESMIMKQALESQSAKFYRVYGYDQHESEVNYFEDEDEEEEETEEKKEEAEPSTKKVKLSQTKEEEEQTEFETKDNNEVEPPTKKIKSSQIIEEKEEANDNKEEEEEEEKESDNKEESDNEEEEETEPLEYYKDSSSDEESNQKEEISIEKFSKSVSTLIKDEIQLIQKEDHETDFWSDYVKDNYSHTGYFPTFEEDRRGMDFEYNENNSYFTKNGLSFPPEATALRNIRQRQNSDDYLLPQREFQHLVKNIAQEYLSHDAQCSQAAYYMLQVAIEEKFTRWATAALIISCGVKKSKVLCFRDLYSADFVAKLM